MTTIESTQELLRTLPELNWLTSPIHIKRLSKDFYWFSPLLKAQLADKKADLVVRPRSEEELTQLICETVRLNIPVTIRGGGTGNYGQSVPLNGGVIIDMTDFNQLNWIKGGVASVRPGMKLGGLEESAREYGLELRCMPSTYKMATIGGLFSGGFGGIGSINYGPISASGNVLAARVMTLENPPRIIELRGHETLNFHHTYGTNGILVELEVALAPARQWDEYMLAFADLSYAVHFAKSITNSVGIDKRNIAVFDAQSAAHFFEASENLKAGEHLVIAIVSSNSKEPMLELLEEKLGHIAWSQTAADMQQNQHTLMEYCWNHSTLHALKKDDSLTYLQANYQVDKLLEQLAGIREQVGDEVGVHLEFIRSTDSSLFVTGLPLIHYSTPERLMELISIHQSLGIKINNPHVYTLEDGKHGGRLSDEILTSKKQNDPHSLLNVGKVRSLC
ncbi:FAD-binding protein [Marinomonas sp. UCMA 3892]|uniref:FAD-binding oxidoreductase n=1 Tax=unclassified Marinomonas TaxID=196814 RepID=UPI00146F6FEE|nr:FAD-binding oxidoreductase [Marinomonas sp. UCMA 3892]NLV00332.1 FAD-binding protein [Marinomonas sp. UCMA 3892]